MAIIHIWFILKNLKARFQLNGKAPKTALALEAKSTGAFMCFYQHCFNSSRFFFLFVFPSHANLQPILASPINVNSFE